MQPPRLPHRVRVLGPSPPLVGEVTVGGAKNSAMPMLAAAVVAHAPVVLERVPSISDLDVLAAIFRALGADCDRDGDHRIRVDGRGLKTNDIPAALSTRLRGSVYALAPAAIRFGQATIGPIGGDPIAGRTLEPHARAYAGFGMRLSACGPGWRVDGGPPRPAEFTLSDRGVSASATALLLAAACEGRSVIRETSTELEVEDLIVFLRCLGADIERDGRDVVVRGPIGRSGVVFPVPVDPVVIGTYGCAAAITGGRIVCRDAGDPDRLLPVTRAFEALGIAIDTRAGAYAISGRPTRGASLATGMFPEFFADLQPPMTALMAVGAGESAIAETVYAARFDHVPGLRAMGAHIVLTERVMKIRPVEALRAIDAAGCGIRETASLLLAALAAEGTSTLSRIDALARGYEGLPHALAALGARIEFPLEEDTRDATLPL